jgi:methionyl-tRNA formyltransferase
MDAKIAAFVYDFPHAKSCDNLINLKIHGFNNVKCFASPWKALNIKSSKTNIVPSQPTFHPRQVANVLGYPYKTIDHDDPSLFAEMFDFDVGIILGARILKKPLTSALPIINAHPGLLPQNRGLDNIKNAILHGLPQAVTFHVVDDLIDRGDYLTHFLMTVQPHYTLTDIYLGLRKLELMHFPQVIKNFLSDDYLRSPVPKGNYFHPLTDDQETQMFQSFQFYKLNYDKIVEKFLDENDDNGPLHGQKRADSFNLA